MITAQGVAHRAGPTGLRRRPREADQERQERATGIEPALEAWKASVQPQHFARRGPDDGIRAAETRARDAG
jgi:hypothetical protein